MPGAHQPLTGRRVDTPGSLHVHKGFLETLPAAARAAEASDAAGPQGTGGVSSRGCRDGRSVIAGKRVTRLCFLCPPGARASGHVLAATVDRLLTSPRKRKHGIERMKRIRYY